MAEIHKYRDEYAKKFNYDIHAICRDVRKKQGQNGRRVISLNPKPAICMQEYIEDLKEEARWNSSFAKTQDKLVSVARQVRKEIEEGETMSLDIE